jgi:hypothetical protein
VSGKGGVLETVVALLPSRHGHVDPMTSPISTIIGVRRNDK